jgi:hypothetical protein
MRSRAAEAGEAVRWFKIRSEFALGPASSVKAESSIS